MTNIEIARQYGIKAYNLTTDDGVWISTNFHDLPVKDRQPVLAVYKSIFPRVEYDKATGALYCYKSASVN